MRYTAPLRDIRFVLDELAGLKDILALPGNEEMSADLVEAVLEENARFVQEVIAPLNRQGDIQPPTLRDGEVTVTPGYAEAFAEFSQGGWQGLQHPQEWGGQGLPKVLAAAASENLNAASLSFSLCPLLTDGVIEALLTVGTEAQKARYIPPLLDGRWTGTMNLTEPQAGSDLALVATRAVPQPDGSYRLSGQKIFITYGEHEMAENIIHLVLARLPDAPAGVKGISLFIVPKFVPNEAGEPGKRNDVWCASLEHKLGIHGSPTAVLLYGSGKGEVGEGAVGYLVGEANRGLEYMFIMMNAARYAVGIQGIAVSERATQQALAYARDRVQGRAVEGSSGPVPIVRHPDVQRLLLTMRALTEANRAVAYVAAAARDHAHQHADAGQRAASQALYEYLVPVVKGYATETAVEVASLGIQVHGGMGFIEETGAAQHYRDARILPIYEGTTAIQANDFLGRKTLRDAGAVAQGLATEIDKTLAELRRAAEAGSPRQAGLQLIARQLEGAVQAYRDTVAFLLQEAPKDVRTIFAGSVPYLMLAGIVTGGWQMARAALACESHLGEGSTDPFWADKFATAVFHAGHILPRAAAQAAAVQAGSVVSVALAGSLIA